MAHQQQTSVDAQQSRLKSLARVSGGALLGVASAAGSALVNYVSQRTGHETSPLAALSSAEVLRVANTLSGLLQQSAGDDFSLPELPQMVVVGTQSSGKSSLLNAIMACDLLPLGESMVTRCPLHLQLVHAPSDSANGMRAEFGTYSSGEWILVRLIHMSTPHPAPSEIAQIRQEIEAQTIALAGPGKCVSDQPIHLRIHSPYVPDLSLVDLPGLTMMALTDQGQPKDIKEQIRALVQAHVEKPRTVILAVLPARTDLEADAALELVKEVDPRGERTIGVLTKIDLMNQARGERPVATRRTLRSGQGCALLARAGLGRVPLSAGRWPRARRPASGAGLLCGPQQVHHGGRAGRSHGRGRLRAGGCLLPVPPGLLRHAAGGEGPPRCARAGARHVKPPRPCGAAAPSRHHWRGLGGRQQDAAGDDGPGPAAAGG